MRQTFYGSFGMQNSMVTLFFKFDPREGQLQVKLRQIRSKYNFKFCIKICLSCAVLSQDSKNIIYLYVPQLEMPKIAFQKCDVITFTWFVWPLHHQKQRHCFEILYACCLCVFLSRIFRFLIN